MRRNVCNLQKRAIESLLIILPIVFFTSQAFAMLDPAATYCTSLGYEFSTVFTKNGEKGLCTLPNGQVVDANDFLEGRVALEWSYCDKEGYEAKHISEPDKYRYYTVCVLPDGTEMEVTKLMGLDFRETTCGDGSCGIPENSSTCPQDCPSGGFDGYCDGVKDLQCDPDCEKNPNGDLDCIDTDKDGFPDYVDTCPESNDEQSINIDGCTTDITNILHDNGCTRNDLIAQCAEDAKNHGMFVSCVAHLANDWENKGYINEEERDTIQSCAGQSDIP